MAKLKGKRVNPKHFSADQIKFYVILIPIAIFMILPVVYMANEAFKPLGELYAFPPTLIVKEPTLNNFKIYILQWHVPLCYPRRVNIG